MLATRSKAKTDNYTSRANDADNWQPRDAQSLGGLGMNGTGDFAAFASGGAPRLPRPAIDHVPAELGEQVPGTSQIYAAAWTIAHRDHEIDKLFNVDFYQGQ